MDEITDKIEEGVVLRGINFGEEFWEDIEEGQKQALYKCYRGKFEEVQKIIEGKNKPRYSELRRLLGDLYNYIIFSENGDFGKEYVKILSR
jgi:hypothetical protein